VSEERKPQPGGEAEEGAGRTRSPSGLVRVYDRRPEGYEGSCLRPLGLCELGGCCDICWYNPEHPRFSKA